MNTAHIFYKHIPKNAAAGSTTLAQQKLDNLSGDYTQITFQAMEACEKRFRLLEQHLNSTPFWFFLRLNFYYYLRELLEVQDLIASLRTSYDSIILYDIPTHLKEFLVSHSDFPIIFKTSLKERRNNSGIRKRHRNYIILIIIFFLDLFRHLAVLIRALRAKHKGIPHLVYLSSTDALRLKGVKDIYHKIFHGLSQDHLVTTLELLQLNAEKKSLKGGRPTHLPLHIAAAGTTLWHYRRLCQQFKNFCQTIRWQSDVQNIPEKALTLYLDQLNPWRLLTLIQGEKIYATYLRWLSPTALICRNASFTPFNMAAKRARIPLIDIQHGITHRYHPSHCFSCLPNDTMNPLPDYVLLWDAQFKTPYQITGHPTDKHLMITGNAYAQAAMKDLNAEAILKDLRLSTGDLKILIAVQRDFPFIYLNLLNQLLKNQQSDLRLIIKTHPTQYQEAVQAFRKIESQEPRVRLVSDDTHCNIFQLIAICDYVVTSGSTVALDASALNKPVLLAQSPALDILAQWLDHFHVIHAHDLAHLDEGLLNTMPAPPAYGYDAAEKNIATAIRSIVHGIRKTGRRSQ